jgi:apolipoprotein N-acyltransferase
MKKSQKYLAAVSAGVILWLAWPPLPFFFLLFVGFVPILWLEEQAAFSNRSGREFFGYSYLALLIWNLLTTWWVGATYFGTKDISTAIAGLLANTANPLLMCIPLVAFHRTKKRLGETWGYLSLIAYWITFEYIHLRWDLTWPWLTLGNGFSQFPQVVQWYEYTGVFGGTAWILGTNILLYKIVRAVISGKIMYGYRRQVILFLSFLFIPILVSLLIYFTYREKGKPREVVVVQPNIDPYNEKFDMSTLDRQLSTLMDLSKSAVDQQTNYLVWPETAISQGIFINDLAIDATLSKVKGFLKPYPNLELVTGINAYERYDTDSTATARYADNAHVWYDAFNTAIQLDSSRKIPYYHKSKLVPGVEQMPYPQLFKFLEPLALQMGGTSGSLGKQKDRSVFFSHDSTGVAPMICYESIYGEYSTGYVQRGGSLFFIITNDGWWGNTAGHKQHLQYARLRAIEMRRDIAQSANTGTSAFIDQRGNLSQQTEWWKPAVIKATLYANEELTFYTRFGDYIGRIAIIFTIFSAVYGFINRFRKKNKVEKLEMEKAR